MKKRSLKPCGRGFSPTTIHWCGRHSRCESKHNSGSEIAAWIPADNCCPRFRPRGFDCDPRAASRPSCHCVPAGCRSAMRSCVEDLHSGRELQGYEAEKSNTESSNPGRNSQSLGLTRNQFCQSQGSIEIHLVRVRETLKLPA